MLTQLGWLSTARWGRPVDAYWKAFWYVRSQDDGICVPRFER